MTSLSILLCQAQRLIVRRLTSVLNLEYITPQQLFMLEAIHANPKFAIGELSEKLNIDRTTFTKNILRLSRPGWILECKGRDPRSKFFKLTEAGIKKLKDGNALLARVESSLNNELGTDLYEQLSGSLSKYLELQ